MSVFFMTTKTNIDNMAIVATAIWQDCHNAAVSNNNYN